MRFNSVEQLRPASLHGEPRFCPIPALGQFAALYAFLANIAPPLGLGTVTLEDRSEVTGFLWEAHAVAGARDITAFGGWRAWRAG